MDKYNARSDRLALRALKCCEGNSEQMLLNITHIAKCSQRSNVPTREDKIHRNLGIQTKFSCYLGYDRHGVVFSKT
ncbi:hypothetical protein EUGRSUZ_C02264 [Eucalyptus grandis]|uniref:Uncharacterized protein n=2 Tax=Eucalyptus grandis TaxID=71139 RepID=A0ACC3LF37_EUCGR|nr:hypothetical protein EUGRSUZ_C02264 [Eucalyptus grandis]